jgi:deazaflavin-dependent oxidoreductase (nitroreductase family)
VTAFRDPAGSHTKEALSARRPQGWLRWLLRFPIWLYRVRLGWLLGERFMLLEHQGRKSGLRRQTVVEVMRHDRDSQTWYAAAAWGAHADWLRNVQAARDVTLTAGQHRAASLAEVLTVDEGARELAAYAWRYPLAYRQIVQRLLGRQPGTAEADFRAVASVVPIVAFHAGRPST